MLAMTGVITATTKKHSLITLLQDMEYVHGQLFERTVESGCGAVTCLPGALTMLRFSAFRRMAKCYFADKAEQCEDLFDYGKCHLGEDRWLTHLFMIGAKKRYQIQMCTSAFCKTEAVQTYTSLIKQRRRWFLGFITNEVCMLTDVRIWKRYPILAVVRFAQNTIRTTGLLFFIILLAIITTSKAVDNLPVGFILISLGLNWLMMIYFGAKLRRFKIWLYPVMFVINPFFNWFYMVYGIFTAGQRTWGGPRADAGAADSNTSPRDAVAHGEATGDDLNVVPETFKQATGQFGPHDVSLQPPDSVDGRFAAAELLPGGWYQHGEDSMVSLGRVPLNAKSAHRRLPLHPRASFDSSISGAESSVYMPRRVESLMSEKRNEKLEAGTDMQHATKGAYMTGAAGIQPFELSEKDFQKAKRVATVKPMEPFHDGSTHERGASYIGVESSAEDSSEVESSTLSVSAQQADGSGLTMSPSVSGELGGTSGRSPLARASLVRTSDRISPITERETQADEYHEA